mgnify:CR=1 FL=1
MNHSNESLWFISELFWFLILVKMFDHFSLDQEFMTQETIPGWILPFRLMILYAQKSEWLGFAMVIITLTCLVHSFAYLLELFGIIAMGRTYQQVNHTEKYEHLYRVVKLKDGTLRNKEIRIFEDGFFIGLLRIVKNAIKFFIC